MAVKLIPDEHHVVRHVPKNRLMRDGGKVTGCFPEAFKLRPNEDYLSCSWFEFFEGDRERRLRQTLIEIRGYLTVKSKDALAIALVGRFKELGTVRSQKIRVLHEPDPPRAPAYSTVRGLQRDDMELLQLLASEAVAETVEVLAISIADV
jgi:hypothetical protein